MSNLTLDVVRADDLLVLRFEFLNLILDPDETQAPRRLIRASAGEDALVIVHFPPQHIAEECFTREASGIVGLPPHREEVRSRIAGPSQLTFRVPGPLESIALTLTDLLDWDAFEPWLVSPDFGLPEIDVGLPHRTAIELPYGLILTPDKSSRWQHSKEPAEQGGRAALWHTRLTRGTGRSRRNDRILPAAPRPAPVRVIAGAGSDPFPMALTGQERDEITQLSSDFEILADDKFVHLTPEELANRPRYDPVPVDVDVLILSALGGWLRAHSRFDFPILGQFLQQMRGHELDPKGSELFSLAEWRHVASMGRDQYVTTVTRGYLYPLMFRADLVNVTEREFELIFGVDRPAYLIKRRFLVVQAQEIIYDAPDLPFQSMRLPAVVTPLLDAIPEATTRFVPKVNRVPFAFPVNATDKQDGVVDFAMPMVFVPLDGIADPGTESEYQNLGSVRLSNQAVAFTRASPTLAPGGSVGTTLNTLAIQFSGMGRGAAGLPLGPKLTEASVRLPAADRLLGTSNPMTIAYDPVFAAAGDAPNGVFARIKESDPLQFPADKAGGLVSIPKLKMAALSTTEGALPALDPNVFLAQLKDTKLLGVIELKDALEALGDLGSFPKLRTTRDANAVTTHFNWKAELKTNGLPRPLEAIKTGTPPAVLVPTLEITGSMVAPIDAGAVTCDMLGTLKRFALLLGVVTVEFDELTFHVVTGAKPTFGAEVRKITFNKPLDFVETLAAELQKIAKGFGPRSGPALLVTPEGITASLTVALPNIPLGVLSIQNVAVSAGLSLYFSGLPARMRFRLSTRENPFLISYSIFGGGGYFELTASTGDTADNLTVEASLEFGAVVTLSLVVATGIVQAMVGIRFTMSPGVELAGFVRLYGCLEVLGILTISVYFLLELRYNAAQKTATGRAVLIVMVRVLAFSKSVTLEVQRSFSAATGPRSFGENVSLAQWTEYCSKFD